MNKKNTLIDEIHILKESSSLNKISSSLIKEIKKGDILYDLPTNWEWVRFGDIASFELGKTPLTSNEEYWGSTSECYNWISISDLDKNLYDTDRKITEKAFKEVFRGRCTPKGTLLMSFKLTIGKVAIAPTDCVHNEAIISIYPYHDILKPYLKACIGVIARNSNDRVYAVKGNTLNKEKLANLLVPLPPKDILIKINDLLSSLDNKIEINNKINQELEELGQALYTKWFVNFDFPNEDGKPYKSSGGEMIESELGMIPKGWKVQNFNYFVESIIGGDWGKEFAQGNYIKEVKCIRGADIPEIQRGNSGKPPTRYVPKKNAQQRVLNAGDMIIEISGGSPTQSTARITYINDEIIDRYNTDIICSNFCRAVSLKNTLYSEYFYIYWNLLYKNKVFFNHEIGTTGIKNFDINGFLKRYPVIVPDDITIERFHTINKEIQKQIQQNGNENKKLEELRDFLIPQLISGNLEIKDIDNTEKEV